MLPFIEINQELIENKEKHYVTFTIPKRNGKHRIIEAPDEELKNLQKQILHSIIYKFKPHPLAHGFVKDRSPITNAKEHVGASIVIKIDIKDFFPSIRKDRVKALLRMIYGRLSPDHIVDIDSLAEILTLHDRLPQGAPTSPAISNLVVMGMEKELSNLQEQYGCKITVYADDIAISSDYNSNLTSIIPEIRKLLRKFGFRMNTEKTKVFRKGRRMSVTGVVVNEKLNIDRRVRRNLRAQLHNIERDHKILTEKEQQSLRGKIEWVRAVNPDYGMKLLIKYKELECITNH